jgi:hypothetical protein
MKRLTAPSPGWLFFISNLAAFAIGAALGFISIPAHAQFVPLPNQSLLPPFDYPTSLTMTPPQVLPIDPLRRRIVFLTAP